MVNFSCDNCGQKIKAPDKFCGRRVKCPKCSSILVVPQEQAKIRFNCRSCGKKISVPETHAGKKGKCPKCKTLVVVPRAASSGVTADQHASDVKISPKNADLDGLLLDVQQKREVPAETTEQNSTYEDLYDFGQTVEQRLRAEQDEHTGERKLPWLIDIFLYPLNVSCLTVLGIIIGLPLVIYFLIMILGVFALRCPPLIVFLGFMGFAAFIVRAVLWFYMYWYYCECIRDSALGGLRAPETMGSTPGLGEMLFQLIKIIGCVAFFIAPMLIYFLYSRKIDTIFWILLGYGVFFCPMGLLAVIMFDSLSGLNPVLLIGSILSTFLPYIGLVLFYYALSSVSIVVVVLLQKGVLPSSQLFSFAFKVVNIYLLFVGGHLLGRFYWRYQEKLNWEV